MILLSMPESGNGKLEKNKSKHAEYLRHKEAEKHLAQKRVEKRKKVKK